MPFLDKQYPFSLMNTEITEEQSSISYVRNEKVRKINCNLNFPNHLLSILIVLRILKKNITKQKFIVLTSN